MYNRDKIISNLKGLVGWWQPFNPTLPTLDEENLTTLSGRLFNENPYIKLDYIKDTQDYIDISDEQFNEHLKRVEVSAISNVIDNVFSFPDFIDRQVLYQNANNKQDLEVGNQGFVGFKICISKDKNVAFEISRVILEFDGVGDVELLLYNSAISTPIRSKTVNINFRFQEEILNWKVDNSDGYYKGEFYFGYIANGLTVTPFKRNYELSDIKSCITYMNFQEGTFKSQTNRELSDLRGWENSNNTFGLNLDITVYDDFTDLIIQNKMLFSRAIQLQGCVSFLDSYIASLRSNRNTRINDEYISKLLIEMNGADDGVLKIQGVKPLLMNEIQRLGSEIKKIKQGYFADGFILNTRQ